MLETLDKELHLTELYYKYSHCVQNAEDILLQNGS